jgi:ABC-type lipoprotein release transport system permease subunit
MTFPVEYSLKGILVRRVSTLLTVGGIALVVVIFVVVMGLARGLQHVYGATGADDNLVFVREGATSPMISRLEEDALPRLRYLPEIVQDAAGEPLMSAEAIENVYLSAGDRRWLVSLRGVDPPAWALHRNLAIVEGRAPARHSNEVALGVALARKIGGARLGDAVTLGASDWTVVGLFRAGDGIFESEAWTDRLGLQRERNRIDFNYVVARVEADDLAAARALEKRWEADPALGVRIVVESDYYARLVDSSASLRAVCLILVGVMGFAMVITGMNTMYGLIAARAREFGTLRVLGFGGGDILLSVLFEATVLGLAGGVAGALLGVVANGLPVSYGGADLAFRIGPALVAEGAAIAAVVGALGGLLPALRASRLEVIEALHTL